MCSCASICRSCCFTGNFVVFSAQIIIRFLQRPSGIFPSKFIEPVTKGFALFCVQSRQFFLRKSVLIPGDRTNLRHIPVDILFRCFLCLNILLLFGVFCRCFLLCAILCRFTAKHFVNSIHPAFSFVLCLLFSRVIFHINLCVLCGCSPTGRQFGSADVVVYLAKHLLRRQFTFVHTVCRTAVLDRATVFRNHNNMVAAVYHR